MLDKNNLLSEYYSKEKAWCLAAAASAAAAYVIQRAIKKHIQHSRFEAVVKQKRETLATSLERARAWLNQTGGEPSAVEIDMVVKCSLKQLVDLQRHGALKAIEILRVYVHNAIRAHEATNCLVWIDVDLAAAAAAAADASRRAGNALGPLHGAPVSIKECIDIATTDSTHGLSSNCGHPAKEDALVVRLIKDAGGIVFCKTNVPQTLMSFECSNYIFGDCVNPHAPTLSCGGSSGGEGTLLALQGSAIGVGTDIGGSIRIPAHFCGVLGFRPSQWRVPTRGLSGAFTGQEAVPAVAGPMGRSVDDILTLFKVMTSSPSMQFADGNVAYLPFRTSEFEEIFDVEHRRATRTLRIGYYVSDGFFPATPACKRAVLEAVAAVRSAGHECIEVKPTYLGLPAVLLYYRLLAADGATSLQRVLGDEPQIPHVKGLMQLMRIPAPLKRFAAFAVGMLDPYLGGIVGSIRQSGVYDYWQLQAARQKLREDAAALFGAHKLDAVIAPGLVCPAVPLGSSANAQMGAMYTALLNLLDMPSVALPVTVTDPASDAWVDDAEHKKCPLITALVKNMYCGNVQGAPVGVQICSLKGRDEQVLACAAVLDAALLRNKKS